MKELRVGMRKWLGSTGEIARFGSNVVRDVWGLRVFRFFGETLRQSGILIISSTLVIWGLVFIVGLGTCGIEGAYFTQAQGAPGYAGVYTAWCDLREAVPYVFGYMMAAKVGTGIVAELGAMRISDEIDVLEVMGVDSMTFLCATRLLAAWLVLPFMYVGAIGVGHLGPWIAVVVHQVASVSSGGYFLIFWEFTEPAGASTIQDCSTSHASSRANTSANSAGIAASVLEGNLRRLLINRNSPIRWPMQFLPNCPSPTSSASRILHNKLCAQ